MSPSQSSLEESSSLEFPFEIDLVDEETTKHLLKDFTGERTGFVQVGPKKYFFPFKYKANAKHIYNFEVRPDDVWIVTFPRSGTTYTQEIVWLLCNNLDIDEAVRVPLLERVPFLEYSLFVHPDVKNELRELNKNDSRKLKIVEEMDVHNWDQLRKSKTRRIIKTHMPFSLLPPNLLTSGCKIIYLARNPKDVSVSFYYLNRLMRTQGYTNDWETYFEYFTQNLQPWTPYWEHVQEGYDQRHNPNVLFMFYEEMVKDVRATVSRIAQFLDVKVASQQYEKLEEHLSIKQFRNNKSVNYDMLDQVGVLMKGEQGFIREGGIGASQANFNSESIQKLYTDWLERNRNHVSDLQFPL